MCCCCCGCSCCWYLLNDERECLRCRILSFWWCKLMRSKTLFYFFLSPYFPVSFHFSCAIFSAIFSYCYYYCWSRSTVEPGRPFYRWRIKEFSSSSCSVCPKASAWLCQRDSPKFVQKYVFFSSALPTVFVKFSCKRFHSSQCLSNLSMQWSVLLVEIRVLELPIMHFPSL